VIIVTAKFTAVGGVGIEGINFQAAVPKVSIPGGKELALNYSKL
jgi:hypothetical protein